MPMRDIDISNIIGYYKSKIGGYYGNKRNPFLNAGL